MNSVKHNRIKNNGWSLTLNFFNMPQAEKKVVYISAVTGQYVPKPYAASHPTTTVRMVVKKGK